MRTEKDSLGSKKIPDKAYYGIHTSRSMENFNLSYEKFPIEIIHSIAKLKIACARANVKLKLLKSNKGEAIEQACNKILQGKYDSQFPIDILQSGSGTSSHMNVNEVIANLAAEILKQKKGKKIIHPNDDVNKGQSTNNVVPSAIKIASYELSENLLNDLNNLVKALRNKEREFSKILKSGRTHLQDAVPITLGQEFGAYASALEKDIDRITEARKRLLELGIGGNAIGTGLNTKKDFRTKIISELRKLTKTNYQVAKDSIEATQFVTDIAHFSSIIKILSLDILKITNDLILLSSGPNTGLGEITLPAVEPGSSIMPGKINPSVCEAVRMACIQVQGYDHAVSIASVGQLELNAHTPLIGNNIIRSIKLMQNSCSLLENKCVKGIKVNREVCKKNFESSAGLATVLNPRLGYDKVAELVKESLKRKKTLKELVLEKKIITKKEFEKLINNSTKPNL